MASRTQRELALLITGKDVSATKALRGVGKEMNKLGSIGSKAGSNVARNIERSVLLGATAAAGAAGWAIHEAQAFESSSTSVRKTVEGNVDAILAANRKLATSKGFDVNQLNEISATAGALDIAADDVAAFTETIALLGITTDDVTTEMGAMSFGHLKTTLNLAGDDFRELGDELVYLGNNGASTEGQILAMAENIAGAASTVGASKEDVLAWASAMASAGEEAEAGGSSVQRFWLESFKSVAKGGKELKLMAKVTGMSAAAFKKAFGADSTGTLATFITKLGKLSKAEQLATLEALGFTDIRIQRALLKLLGNTDNLTQSMENVTKASGAMGAEAEKRFKDSAQQAKILEANVKDAAITIGTELLPVVNELMAEGVDWLQGHQGEIAEFARDLADGIRDAVKWAHSLDWDAIGNALGAAAGAAKTLVDIFAGLPPEVMALLAGGFVANKFTGGAIGDLGKLGIQVALQRGMTPANPMWVAMVGGGLGAGGAGAAGAAGGGLKGFASMIVKGLVGAGAVMVGSNVLSGGIQQGGAMGAAQGALGGAGMIGGGALLAGPLGAIAGSIAAVGQTFLQVTGQSSQMAADIGNQIDAKISGGAKLSDLQAMLAGVDAGINEIQANPLNVLVAGDALDTLKASRADIVAQIKSLEHTSLAAKADAQSNARAASDAAGRQAAQTSALLGSTKTLDAHTLSGLSGVISQVNASKNATVTASGAVAAAARGAGQLSAAAIRDKDLSVTFSPKIVTNVSVKETINSQTTYYKYQKYQS